MNAEAKLDPQTVAAITACARDYAEGWYEGNATRMRRALHPDLCKHTLIADPFRPGAVTVGPKSDAEYMVRLTQEGGGATYGEGEDDVSVEILHIFRDIASVACLSRDYMDYLQIGNFGTEGWKIVHALWQPREGLHDPSKWATDESMFWTPG